MSWRGFTIGVPRGKYAIRGFSVKKSRTSRTTVGHSNHESALAPACRPVLDRVGISQLGSCNGPKLLDGGQERLADLLLGIVIQLAASER